MYQPKLIKLLIFLLVLLSAPIAYANKIDELKTDKDVFDLLISIDAFRGSTPIDVMPTDTLLKKLNCKEVAMKWGIKAWQKLDFNNDKRTDLIVTVKDGDNSLYIFAIIDNGHAGLRCIEVSSNRGDFCQIAKPIIVDGKQMLAYYSKRFRMVNHKLIGQGETEQVDTLTYLFNGFVEYNRRPVNYAIKSISIKVGDSIMVTNQGKVAYRPGMRSIFRDTVEFALAVDSSSKIYVGKISLSQFNNIKALINYIDIRKKQKSYSVLWTDDTQAKLTVEFADGTKKKINDYGMIGSFGLTRLYDILLDLKGALTWKPLEK